MPITRSPAQKSACKDLKRNGQTRAITFKAALFCFMPITRSLLRNLRKATQT
ncbi:acetyltransferase [Lacticaseibacillus rhamnosus]|nr:acetyltransferase [Lacticaseibacillus rhamnosus]MCT3144841.1 acetyltransferase [Lacticaseibacillus rhamnosus]MCT3154713.1 acetyltransferase [Lacticaseibacillus rhamnosus]MCT3162808.1 acetyltransferase [Lacticaseibacillus rhamnosus]MCT3164931.1 acetyltransferase [Lacticaseibacillus rhamnosus]